MCIDGCCRDLKLDNTLMDGQKPPFLKICDFGFARHFDQKHGLDRSVSHIGCAPPCMCDGQQQARTDGFTMDAYTMGEVSVVTISCLCQICFTLTLVIQSPTSLPNAAAAVCWVG